MGPIRTVLMLLLVLAAPAADLTTGTAQPPCLADIGKTVTELRRERPEAEIAVRPDGLPDAAAICLAEPDAPTAAYLFGTQSGDFTQAIEADADQLRCAGVVSTVGELFPARPEAVDVSDFCASIGVDDYTLYSWEDDDTISAAGWLSFSLWGRDVWIHTDGSGGVGSGALVSVTDAEIERANWDLLEKSVLWD